MHCYTHMFVDYIQQILYMLLKPGVILTSKSVLCHPVHIMFHIISCSVLPLLFGIMFLLNLVSTLTCESAAMK